MMETELRDFARAVAAPDAFAAFLAGPGAALPDRLGRLAALTGERPGELSRAFGRRMFERFVSLYPDFVPLSVTALDYLEHIERHVHEEIRALYPEARPPRLCCVRLSPTRLLIRYWSATPAAEMCEGMIEAALAHFETRAMIRRREAKDAAAVFEVSLATDD